MEAIILCNYYNKKNKTKLKHAPLSCNLDSSPLCGSVAFQLWWRAGLAIFPTFFIQSSPARKKCASLPLIAKFSQTREPGFLSFSVLWRTLY